MSYLDAFLDRLLFPFSQYRYERYAESYGVKYMLFVSVLCGLFSAIAWVSGLSSATVYFSDKSLLEGTAAIGNVLDIEVKKTSWLWPVEYTATVTYAFFTEDGRRFTGVARRKFSLPSQVDRGSRINVLYDRSNPELSAIAVSLSRHLADLRTYLWTMLFGGIFWGVFPYRYVRWRFHRSACRGNEDATAAPQARSTGKNSCLGPAT